MCTHLTSRAKAIIPAARGADADVPVCFIVQPFSRSVVAYESKRQMK